MTLAALLNHLWQSTAFAAAAAALAWRLRHHQARVRFWIWLAASLKFLLPFSALAALGALLPQARTASAPPLALAAATQPFATVFFIAPPSAVAAPRSAMPWLGLLALLWLAGSFALALRWWRAWRRMSRLARAARPAWAGGMPLRLTPSSIEPGVFGIFRPLLLLPQGLIERLSPAQLEAVLAHERCHLRRRDNLWAALQCGVETLFWFHPMVW
ncbi:MAG: M56 family metallopeptidase, partial [Terriglobales bacterium]